MMSPVSTLAFLRGEWDTFRNVEQGGGSWADQSYPAELRRQKLEFEKQSTLEEGAAPEDLCNSAEQSAWIFS